jgi:hypothetical protein
MKGAALGLAILLFFGTLTLWVEERLAWSLFQLGAFLLAGWRLVKMRWRQVPVPFWPLAAACCCAVPASLAPPEHGAGADLQRGS